MTGLQTASVVTVDVGHGDAILIDWRDGDLRWTCLVDGGESGEPVLRALAAHGIDRLDLVVASHLDSDHINGLIAVADRIPIASYWGPALPAFERHRWLFGARTANALERGRDLEALLSRSGASIVYPVEGFRAGQAGWPHLQVLSPAARVIERLLTADDVEPLFISNRMPLGWLLRPPPEVPEEEDDRGARLRARLATGALMPDEIPTFAPSSFGGVSADELRAGWAAAHGRDPDYFGDPVLNDTSLVIWLELPTGRRIHRLLLPGDQENWTYLFARHPRGLQADLLKASHHGGRVYIEDETSHDELLRWIRPRAVIMSANGRHGLPRASIRTAAIHAGATVFCTSQRGSEYVVGAEPDATSCHAAHDCSRPSRGDVALALDESGIRATRAACHTGHARHDVPVIELRHHIVDPSPVMTQLFEQEMRKHIGWVKKYLGRIHQARVAHGGTAGENQAVTQEHIEMEARRSGREMLVPNLPAVFQAGTNRGEFWATGPRRHSDNPWLAYRLPSDEDVAVVLRALEEFQVILFAYSPPPPVSDCDSILAAVPANAIAQVANREILLPTVAFRDALLPRLALGLRRAWHGFRHSDGRVAISRIASAKELVKHMVQACRYVPDRRSDSRLLADERKLLLSAPEPIERGARAFQRELTETWFTDKSPANPYPVYDAWTWLFSGDADTREEWSERIAACIEPLW